MHIDPYLFLNGRCEEAIAFYRRALDAEVNMLMRYKEAPEPPPADRLPPGWQDKVMHASLRIGDSELMMSDGRGEEAASCGFALTLSVPDEAAAERVFAALAEGGQVQMPLAPTFFSPRFGMLADRFGVPWMVLVAPPD